MLFSVVEMSKGVTKLLLTQEHVLFRTSFSDIIRMYKLLKINYLQVNLKT